MGMQPIEKLLPKSNWSIYRLVRMAAIRALELSEGKPCLIEKPSSDKFTSIALEEIAEGKIEYKGMTDHPPAEEKPNEDEESN